MFQGGHEAWAKNQAALDFDLRRLDFVLLTHAHIDHSGLLPRLSAWDTGADPRHRDHRPNCSR